MGENVSFFKSPNKLVMQGRKGGKILSVHVLITDIYIGRKFYCNKGYYGYERVTMVSNDYCLRLLVS